LEQAFEGIATLPLSGSSLLLKDFLKTKKGIKIINWLVV